MADERNTIEIILKARDETSAAFSALAAKMGLQKEMAKEMARENKNLEDSTARLTSQAERQRVTFEDLRGSFAKSRSGLADNIKLNDELAKAYVNVERTAKQAVETQDRRTHSLAEQAVAEKNAATAQKELSTALRDQIKEIDGLSDADKKYMLASATRHAAQVRQANEEITLNKQRKRAIEDVAASDQAAARQAARDEDVIRSAKIRRYQEEDQWIARIEKNRANAARAEKTRQNQEVSDIRRSASAFREYEAQVQRAAKARNDLNKGKLTGIDKIRVEIDEKAALAQIAVLKRRIESIKDAKIGIDIDSAAFDAHAGEIEAVKSLIGKNIHINVDADIGAAIAKLGELEVAERSVSNSGNNLGGTLSSAFGSFTNIIAGSTGGIAQFDNVLRGAATFAVVGFLQPLITLGGAAAGALIAVGSAAIYAGGALGGALVAGLSQALPVLGVIALAVGRISAVFGAAKQAQTAQQATTAAGIPTAQKAARAHDTQAKAANTLANSTDSVKTAEEGLANAHRSVGTAEAALSKARQQARRDLQDLTLAEKEAQLQAESAVLSQKNAQLSLAETARTGGDVDQARLALENATLDRQRSAQAATRARGDLSTAQSQGVEGAPGVVSAKKQVEDAKRSVDDAERSVTRAKRSMDSAGVSANQAAANAAAAGAGISAAGLKADQMIAKLSPAEQRLEKIVIRFKDAFLGFSQYVTEPIIKSFGDMINKIIGFMNDGRIRETLRSLSSTIATEATRFFNAFTNKGAINTFLGFIREAQSNLKPLTDILIDLGKIFLNIARAAAPSLSRLLGFIKDVTDGLLQITRTTQGKKDLAKFFDTGTTALIAFLKLGGAVVKLFLAIAGPGGGAKTGIDLINGLTKIVNNLADAINTKGTPAWKTFHDLFRITKEVIKDLAPLFTSIGNELGKAFSEKGVDSLKAFVNILSTIIIPALGKFIRDIGTAVAAIGKFLDKHPQLAQIGADFLGVVLALGIARKAASLLLSPFEGLFKKLDFLIDKFKKVRGAADDAAGAASSVGGGGGISGAAKKGGGGVGMIEGMGASAAAEGGVLTAGAGGAEGAVATAGLALPPVAIVAGIVAALTGLLAVTGNLKPVLKAIGDAFDHVVKVAGPPLQDLIKQVKDLFKAFEGGKGAFAIVKPIMTFFTNQVLIRAIKSLGDVIGSVFGGIFKVLGGFVELITGIITLNPQKIVEAFKKMGLGIIEVFGNLAKFVGTIMEIIPLTVIRALTTLIPKLLNLGKRLVRTIGNALEDLGKIIGHAFSSAFNKALDYVEGLIGKFRNRAGRIVNGIVNALSDVGGKALHVITSGFNTVTNFFSGLPKKFKDKASDIVDAIVSVFKGLGGKIIDAIGSAAAHGVDFAKQFGKTVAQLIDKAIPDKISMPGPIPDISLPHNPLKDLGLYAYGGPVPGSGRGDRIPALLEPGEHVLTRSEVQAAGGHGAIFALRRILGGGTQGGPFGFAEGGAVKGQDKGQQAAAAGKIDIDFGTSSKEIDKFTDKVVGLWNTMWKNLRRATNNGTNQIENTFKDFSNAVRNLVNQLSNRASSAFDKMRKSISQDANQLATSVKQSFTSLDNTVYQGLSYMGTAANSALKSFGAKAVSLSVDKPKGLAGGGWIGQQGERGRDAIPTLLGRGEAVLNWGHQKLVDPALRAAYGFGLPELFNHTGGFHAGDKGTSPGFAEGGSSHYARLVQAANRVNAASFPYVWGGGHEQPAHFEPFDCSGSVSYVTQQAGYKIPTSVSGSMGSIGLPSGPGAVTIYYNPTHTFMKIGQRYFGTSGFARPNGGAGWFTQSPSPSYLAGFQTVHLPDLGADAPFMTADGMSGIQKMAVHGTGVLKTIAQAVLDKVTGKANDYISKKESALSAGSGQMGDFIDLGGTGPVAQVIYRILKAAGFNKIGAAGVIGNAYAESGLNPGAMEPGTHNGGLWGFTASPVSLSDLQAFAASVNRPWTDVATQTQFMLNHIDASWRAHANAAASPQAAATSFMMDFERPGIPREDVRQSAAATAFRSGMARGGFVGKYDVGGELPGGEGQPIPIIAHGREWILNRGQQQKVARWLGTSRDRLKGALGFMGGPTSYAGGGDTGDSKSDDKDKKAKDDDVILDLRPFIKPPPRRRARLKQQSLDDILKVFDDYADVIEGLIGPDGVRGMERMVSVISRQARKVNVQLAGLDPKSKKFEKDFNAGLDKFYGVMKDLTNDDSGLFAQLDATIDAHATQMATGLSLAETGLRRVQNKLRAMRHPLDDVKAADRQVDITLTTLRELSSERRSLVNDLTAVNKRLAYLRKDGVTKGEKDDYVKLLGFRNKFLVDLDDADSKIAQARQDKFTNAQALLTAQLEKQMDKATSRGEATVSPSIVNRLRTVIGKFASNLIGRHAISPDTLNRIGTALGRTGMVEAATDEQLAIFRDQQKVVENKLKEVRKKHGKDPRWAKQIDDLETQLQDLTASIVETQAQRLQQRVDDINNQAGRRQASIDLFGRIADVQEKMGDPATAARTRLSVLQGTGQNLLTQRAQLQAALQTATIQHNTGMMETLTDQINDLSVQVAENTAAMSDQTVAIRQVTIDAIQNRATFQTGVFGGLGSLAQQIATNLTADTSGQQAQYLNQIAGVLQQQAAGLAQQLFSGYGVNLMGLSGLGFAQAVSALPFDQIEGGMTTAQKGQFEALIQALIDNQNALAQNTGQLNDLNGSLGAPQSFSSTAWQWFRMAAFSGAGQLLPQFQIPQMQAGGFIKRSGIFQLHAGEFVVNPSGSNISGGNNVSVTVHEAGPETDYTYLANRIAFASRTPST